MYKVMSLSYEVACSSMRLVANMGHKGFLDGLGISRSDFDRLIGSEPWTFSDRNRMTVVLHTLINAGVDQMGLPRFDLPAEYIAAGICMFVHGVNVQAACVFAPPSLSAEDSGRMAKGATCSDRQLFALVVQLYDCDVRTQARASFEKSTGLALERAIMKNEPIKK